MRKLILGVALASSALASPALARSKSWYVEGDGGVMLQENTDVKVNGTSNAATYDSKTGYDFGGIVGYDFGAFRLEAEGSYRRSKADNLLNNSTGVAYYRDNGEIAGHASALSFMGNALIDFGPDDGLQGFIGGGVGVAKVDYGVTTAAGILDDSDTRFAWQVLAGVRAPISKHIDVGLKYRFFNVSNVNLVGSSGSWAGSDISGRFRSHGLGRLRIVKHGGPEERRHHIPNAPCVVGS